MSALDDIRAVFAKRGGDTYGEGVSQLEHALQCAACAERDGASPALIAATLLHDIGHLLHDLPQDIADAIRISNSTVYGLSSGICTNRFDYIQRFIKELVVGTVNVREVPGYRIEMSPFGGIKDSGLGYKEGVIEAMKAFTNVKTFSLPWS